MSKLKVRPEHYTHMQSVIEAYLTQNNITRDDIVRIHKGFTHYVLVYNVILASKLTKYICDNVYAYANDEHINTAIRKIIGIKKGVI